MVANTNTQRAAFGLSVSADPSSTEVSNTVRIGTETIPLVLSNATIGYAFTIEIDGAAAILISAANSVPTIEDDLQAQVETATAVGTISGSGDAAVIITSDIVTGSPLAVPVAVVAADTAATWAGKVRTALGLLPAITDHFTVGGASETISLTALEAAKDDATLNISLDNGTCTGITPALTSVTTTPGIAPSKCYRMAGTTFSGDDFEGSPLPVMSAYYGMLIRHLEGTGTLRIISATEDPGVLLSILVNPGGLFQEACATGISSMAAAATFEFTSANNQWLKAEVVLLASP